MSASRFLELLQRPLVFQPLCFGAFSLFTWNWMDYRIRRMSNVINVEATQKATSKTDDDKEAVTAQLDPDIHQLRSYIDSECDSIKALTDENMREISDKLDQLTANQHEFNTKQLQIETAANQIKESLKGLNYDQIAEAMYDIQHVFDSVMNETDKDEQTVNKLMDFEKKFNALESTTKCFQDQINEIKEKSDENMLEIAETFQKLQTQT